MGCLFFPIITPTLLSYGDFFADRIRVRVRVGVRVRVRVRFRNYEIMKPFYHKICKAVSKKLRKLGQIIWEGQIRVVLATLYVVLFPPSLSSFYSSVLPSVRTHQ